MKKTPRKGDHVTWNSDVGQVTGTVQKKLTRKTTIKKHVAKASKEDPQYLVKSDKTGKVAAHKQGALKKTKKASKKTKKASKKTKKALKKAKKK